MAAVRPATPGDPTVAWATVPKAHPSVLRVELDVYDNGLTALLGCPRGAQTVYHESVRPGPPQQRRPVARSATWAGGGAIPGPPREKRSDGWQDD
jgi:hypothetical protein